MATLNFKGKSFVQNHHLSVKYHQLVPKKDKSLTNKVSLNDNLIIHGDNLVALKALLPTYAGKVKCIYIDPPYNTGNEKWIYNDNVNSPMMQEWLGKVVDKEDFTRHDKWLCMMMPRLKLLRELLADNGVIFVSIDDHEVHHLRTLMDEVFGEDNFVGQTIRVSSPTQNIAKFISIMHDYALVYCKNKENNEGDWEVFKNNYEEFEARAKKLFEMVLNAQEIEKELRELVKYPRFYDFDHFYNCDKEGVYQTVSAGGVKKGNTKTQILHPVTKKPCKIPQDGWRYKEEEIRRIEKENLWHFGEDENTIPRKKLYIKDYLTQNPKGINFFDTQRDIRFLREIGVPFDFPKPIEYIKHLIRMVTKSGDIVLDSFAGSGTTAHAVLDLNNEDDGNRKFILVECEDYAEKITAERVRRVIKGVKNAKDEKIKKGLEGTFSFFELGEPIEIESILEGKKLPDYMELARYIFYTATGEEFNPSKVKQSKNFIGETKDYEVYLFYEPDIEKLKKLALTLDTAKKLGPFTGKKRLVFAPTKYLDLNDADLIEKHGLKGIEYCQLPFEIYKMRG